MPTYSAAVWPAMVYPAATDNGLIGAAQPANNSIFPVTRSGDTTSTTDWASAAAAPNTTVYRSAVTTQQEIYTEFEIVDPRLTGQSP